MPAWRLALRMFGFLRPVRATAVVAGAVVLGRVGAEVLAVHLLRPAFTAVAGIAAEPEVADAGLWAWLTGESASAAELRTLLAWMAGSQLLLAWTIYLRNVWDGKFSMYAVFYIREAVYDRLQRVGFAFHDRMTSGQLINRALSDLQNVRQFLNLSLLTATAMAAEVLGYWALLWWYSPWLAGVVLLPVPAWCWVVLRFSRRAQPLYDSQQEAADALMTGLTENVAGVHVVRGFGTERQEIAKYGRLNQTLLDRMFAMVSLQRDLAPALRGIAVASHIALFLTAGWLIGRGLLDVGALIPIGVAVGQILGKLQQINVITEGFQKAVVSGRRLFEVLDTPVESAAPPVPAVPSAEAEEATAAAAPKLSWKAGEVRFEGVRFGYDPAKPVLRGVEAVIPGGKLTAVVGPTGAGKSTLVSLIARFYDPQGGRVLIDGQDIRRVDLPDLRRSVGYVFQETFLFSDTIRNNIRYGRADVSDEMVEAAAEAAQAAEFIRKLPDGYDTMLGERGITLSGGQRQRMALARALVYDPKILVLDDATAALDPETEAVVATILNLLFADRTVVMIAHRISTVRRADHVLVVEDGRVVQSGTHRDLLARDGHYREIARMQLGEERDEAPGERVAPEGR
jgi:ATP-binding cassette subfamily B protein